MMCLSTIPKLEAHHWQARRRLWVIQVDVHESLRQKSTAVLKLVDLGAVMARLSVPITQSTAELIETSVTTMITMPPAAPDRDQDPGVESGEYTGRTRLNKRKADCISRSQYEDYLFQVATKHNLSEAAQPLLWMNCWRCSLLSTVTRTFSCVPMWQWLGCSSFIVRISLLWLINNH